MRGCSPTIKGSDSNEIYAPSLIQIRFVYRSCSFVNKLAVNAMERSCNVLECIQTCAIFLYLLIYLLQKSCTMATLRRVTTILQVNMFNSFNRRTTPLSSTFVWFSISRPIYYCNGIKCVCWSRWWTIAGRKRSPNLELLT